MLSSRGAKALAKRAPQTQRVRPYKAASPINATRVSWVTRRNSSRDVDNRHRHVNRRDVSTCATLADEQRRQVKWQRQGHHPQTTRPSTPTRSAAITLKIASRAAAIATTTTKSAATTRITTITTNATSVVRTSPQKNIARRNRAAMRENWARAAEKATSATKKITMSILVKYFEERGRSMCLEGLQLAKIFEMRSHLIPRSIWQTHYFKMSLTSRLMRSRSLMTSRIRLPSNDAPRQWNWIDKIPNKEQLSIDNNIISTKVTTGNAPNKLKVINNMVEMLMLFQKKIVMSKEPLIKLMCSQVKPNSHQLL